MIELDDNEAETVPDSPELDLTGVPDVLRDVMQAYAQIDLAAAQRELSAARRVHLNKDGAVIVSLVTPVKLKDSEHDSLRLRPLKAKDFFDGTTESIAEDNEFAPTLRFAAKLAKPVGIIDELGGLDDAKAVYFGVIAARKNFSRPKS